MKITNSSTIRFNKRFSLGAFTCDPQICCFLQVSQYMPAAQCSTKQQDICLAKALQAYEISGRVTTAIFWIPPTALPGWRFLNQDDQQHFESMGKGSGDAAYRAERDAVFSQPFDAQHIHTCHEHCRIQQCSILSSCCKDTRVPTCGHPP